MDITTYKGAKVFVFHDTGEAYDAVQTMDEINDGDILLIPDEGVVGIAWTWPIAITKECGELHQANEGMLYNVLQENGIGGNISQAMILARSKGYELEDELNMTESTSFDFSIFEVYQAPALTSQESAVALFKQMGVVDPKRATPVQLLQAVSENHKNTAHLPMQTQQRILAHTRSAFKLLTGEDMETVANKYGGPVDEGSYDDMMPRSFQQIVRAEKLGMNMADDVIKQTTEDTTSNRFGPKKWSTWKDLADEVEDRMNDPQNTNPENIVIGQVAKEFGHRYGPYPIVFDRLQSLIRDRSMRNTMGAEGRRYNEMPRNLKPMESMTFENLNNIFGTDSYKKFTPRHDGSLVLKIYKSGSNIAMMLPHWLEKDGISVETISSNNKYIILKVMNFDRTYMETLLWKHASYIEVLPETSE